MNQSCMGSVTQITCHVEIVQLVDTKFCWLGSAVLINGASGNVGGAAVQLAVARGAHVIGTASPANHDYVRSLGAEPVAYGEGMVDRVRALAPEGVDLALDVAGAVSCQSSSSWQAARSTW